MHDQRVVYQSTLDAISGVETLGDSIMSSVPEIHHSDQGVQYLSDASISRLRHHGIEILVTRRGYSLGERIC
ncbi:MAG: hypothetical protein OXU23_27985 [Candidatus Poribacteria bacterium]|nr:hypothetical protein [Candidatus Poribacteria bacterium]